MTISDRLLRLGMRAEDEPVEQCVFPIILSVLSCRIGP